MTKARFFLSLVGLLCLSLSSFAQTLTTNNNRNVYLYDPAEANLHVGSGRVGIGPTSTNFLFQTFVDPRDLLHIHGWNPTGLSNNLYMEPTLRISLEETANPSQIFGFLTMQNKDLFGAGVAPKVYSALAQN